MAQSKPRSPSPPALSLGELFAVFFKAGMAFGGGLGILAVMERELVANKKAVTKEEFLTYYGMGRVVPSGTMTALAVAYGYKFGGFTGTVVALAGLVAPAFIITIVLTLLYNVIKDTSAFAYVKVSILPAAVGLILVAAFSLGKDLLRISKESFFALVALAAALVFRINPSIILLAGGVLGALLLQPAPKSKP